VNATRSIAKASAKRRQLPLCSAALRSPAAVRDGWYDILERRWPDVEIP